MTMPETGAAAPDFELKDSMERPVSLGSQRGKWVVLYFYPKDDTTGCTAEAIDFTAMKGDFDAQGAVILGISPDSCGSHQKFMIKYDLGITLLSDDEHRVCELYGVWGEKNMYGKKFFGVSRSTFLIDPAGRVARVWKNVKVNGHAEDVLGVIRTAAASG